MSLISDIIGTTASFFKLGNLGVRLKNNSGNLAVRNTGDSADAEITASKVNVSGDVGLVINSDSAGTGADWKITLQRPTSGMTADVLLTLPVDDGTPNQVLSTDGSGTLSWASAASNASSNKLHTTSLAFGTGATTAMFSTGAGDVITKIEVIVDTAFNGTPTVTIGIAGTTSKYMTATQSDLTGTATTVYEATPGLAAQGAEALVMTYSAGSASVGAARVIVYYATPA